MKKLLTFIIFTAFINLGCAATKQTVQENKNATTGTLAGAAIGAGVGYAIGKDSKGTAIGAAVGALTGGGIGYMMDRQEREFRRALAASEAASIARQRTLEAEQQDAIIVTFKSDVMFDSGSAILKPGAYHEIDRVAEILNRYPDTSIRIEGHTDSLGDEVYNQQLSERRTMAVKNALIAKGVGSERIHTIGFGEAIPLASNDTVSGRQQNRRVSIVIIPA